MIRKFLIFAAVAASLALASCGTTGALNTAETVGQAVPAVTQPTAGLIDEKALYAAEAAYNVAATGYLNAVDSGALKDPTKALVKACLMDAYSALVLGRKAQKIGDAPSFGAQVGIARRLAEQAATLKPCQP